MSVGLGLRLSGGFGFGGGQAFGGDGGSLGLVEFLFSLEASLLDIAFGGIGVAFDGSYLGLFFLEPLVEAYIGLFLADSALFDAYLEVATEEDTLIGEDTADGVGRLSAVFEPLDGLVAVEVDSGGVGERVVGA